jgi:TrmH family RNA methyltransferase
MDDTHDEVIRSADNRTLKLIRSLRQRKTRELERAFVVEGVRAVEDALHAGGRPRLVLLRADAEMRPSIADLGVPVRRVAPQLFNQVSETEHPQPLLAVFDVPNLIPNPSGAPFYVIADGIQDPGNLGTLLRSAAAVDVTAVLLMPGTVDPFNGKVVRAAMGAHFRVPIVPFDSSWREEVIASCPTRVLAEAEAPVPYDEVDWRASSAVIVGSEAHGSSEFGRSLATISARIPLLNGVESLNAGVAASVMLFEAARQRRLPQKP